MKCDMHVHTLHSGMCTVPLASRFCRESYSRPEAVYQRLKRLGMDLVTVTDHDSIDAAESLRRHPDFFLSEEVTCRMPSGTEIHLGVFDIAERHHFALQRLRDDFESLVAYLREQNLFFSINHAFSGLTGRRDPSDFDEFARVFPAVETLNGHMLARSNENCANFAAALGKSPIGGSDAHTLASAGLAWTEVEGARDKAGFLAALRLGGGRVGGQAGGYWKLTRDILRICVEMVSENPATAVLAPLVPLVPLATLGNYLLELRFASRYARQSGVARPFSPFDREPDASPAV